MTPPTARLLTLYKTQSQIFNTVFNPERLRLGTKILRQRLRGPAFAAYYPRRVVTIKDLRREYPGYEILDDEEEDRVEGVQMYVFFPYSVFLFSGFSSMGKVV